MLPISVLALAALVVAGCFPAATPSSAAPTRGEFLREALYSEPCTAFQRACKT